MEQENNMYYGNYSGFQVVSRKNKKKKRQRSKQFSSPEELRNDNESQQLESADDNVSEVESDDIVKETVGPISDQDYVRLSSVSTDAMMKAPPEVTPSPDKEIVLKNVEEVERQLSYDDRKAVYEETVEERREHQSLPLNTNALSKYATTYELERFEKNALVIFNQESVDGHSKRLGTEKDVESLKRTFENFNFEVVEHKDLTKDEIFRELKTFSDQNFTDYGCVAVAVLTHGSNNGLLRAKDQQYSEIEIINHFKVFNRPTLVTKPKIIVIQACRGTKIVPGVPVFHAGKVRKDVDEDTEPYILPVESDMLILHSSYSGSPSHRNELHGTWFIQELCNKIEALSTTQDIESIITEVKREVAINKHHEEYNKKTFEMDVNKQMPVMTSTLIRKLFLRKYGEVPRNIETYADRKKESISSESRHEVLDNAVPHTPLLVQLGPCYCFLDHFNYMRICLRNFIEDNPDDETGRNFLEVANTFEDGVEFNTAKEKMSKAISKHLMSNAQRCPYYKYLYFYKH